MTQVNVHVHARRMPNQEMVATMKATLRLRNLSTMVRSKSRRFWAVTLGSYTGGSP